jgi:O-antigen/teichoic acid export membrane protein
LFTSAFWGASNYGAYGNASRRTVDSITISLLALMSVVPRATEYEPKRPF